VSEVVGNVFQVKLINGVAERIVDPPCLVERENSGPVLMGGGE